MYAVGNIHPYQPRWQGIVLLLTVLAVRRGGLSKQEALGEIVEEGWFAIEQDDKIAYPSNLERGCTEARWKTGICWARKDCVEKGLLETNGQRDNWNVVAAGLDWRESVARACKAGNLDVRQCYLWSQSFKRRMQPAYQPGRDKPRPLRLYDDWFVSHRQEWLDDLLKGLDF